MWRVSNLDNKVKLTKAFKKELKEKIINQEISEIGDIHYCDVSDYSDKELDESLFDGNNLLFNEDHFEHIDYLSHNKKLIQLMNNHKLKGMISFGSLDGDNFGEFWGYQFSNGKMKKVKGEIKWK